MYKPIAQVYLRLRNGRQNYSVHVHVVRLPYSRPVPRGGFGGFDRTVLTKTAHYSYTWHTFDN